MSVTFFVCKTLRSGSKKSQFWKTHSCAPLWSCRETRIGKLATRGHRENASRGICIRARTFQGHGGGELVLGAFLEDLFGRWEGLVSHDSRGSWSARSASFWMDREIVSRAHCRCVARYRGVSGARARTAFNETYRTWTIRHIIFSQEMRSPVRPGHQTPDLHCWFADLGCRRGSGENCAKKGVGTRRRDVPPSRSWGCGPRGLRPCGFPPGRWGRRR